jgi:hypothetical protein
MRMPSSWHFVTGLSAKGILTVVGCPDFDEVRHNARRVQWVLTASWPAPACTAARITGLEHIDDILADLDAGFRAAKGA